MTRSVAKLSSLTCSEEEVENEAGTAIAISSVYLQCMLLLNRR